MSVASMIANFSSWSERKKAAARQGLRLVTEQTLGESVRLCPVSPTDPEHDYYTGHSGALRDSAQAIYDGAGFGSTIGFYTDYAIYVHEVTWYNHQYQDAVNSDAQAKFLAVPMLRVRLILLPTLAEEMRNA